MDKEILTRQTIIPKDGHFMPLVFVDLSISSATIGAACTYAGRSIHQELKDGKKKFQSLYLERKNTLVPLTVSITNKNYLLSSISDIKI